MSRVELSKLKRELEQAEITYKKLSELDSSEKVFCSFGRLLERVFYELGTMFMAQPHESASSQLKAKMDRLNQKIESVAVGIHFKSEIG